VELMVAIALGAIIVLGLTEMLASTNATYAREEQFARLQENGRIASMIAARHMRPSRSTNCKSIAMHELSGTLTVKACELLEEPATCSGEHYLGKDRALGYDGGDDLSDPSKLDDLPQAARQNIANRWVLGDVIVAWGIDPSGTALNGPLSGLDGTAAADGTGLINLERVPDNLDAGNLAMISDCQHADVFEISGPEELNQTIEHARDNAAGSTVNADDALAGGVQYNNIAEHANAPRATLYRLLYKVFYICCVHDGSLQTGPDVDGCRPAAGEAYDPNEYRPALCAFDLQELTHAGTGESNVLVPEVADMRVTYTGDSDGDGEIDFRADDQAPIPTATWVTAKDAWEGVRSASVELLLTTESPRTATQASAPARNTWPPNSGDAIDADTLGADYPPQSRLFQRFRFDVALRVTTPWNLAE
jgi:hypothetical protein